MAKLVRIIEDAPESGRLKPQLVPGSQLGAARHKVPLGGLGSGGGHVSDSLRHTPGRATAR